MHPFFELAFSLRPLENLSIDNESDGMSPPITTEQTVGYAEYTPRWGEDASKWRCMLCMPFKKHFQSQEELDDHLWEHKMQKSPRHEGGVCTPGERPEERSNRVQPEPPRKNTPSKQEALSFGLDYMRDIGEDTVRSPKVPLSAALLESIDPDIEETQLLILAATRDSALRIHDAVSALAEPLDITAYPCIGGTVIRIDMMALSDGPHIVSGTLGRVEDMIRRGALRTSHISVLAIVQSEIMFQSSTYESWFHVWSSLGLDVSIVNLAFGEEKLGEVVGRWRGNVERNSRPRTD